MSARRNIAVGLVILMALLFCQSISGQEPDDTTLPPHLRRLAEAILADQPASESELKTLAFRTSIFEFVRANQIDVINQLMQSEVNFKELRDQVGNTPLHIAAWNGDNQMVEKLLKAGCDIDALNESGRSPLFGAATSNRQPTVTLLLQKGADVNGNSKHNSPLCGAAWYGHLEIVRRLLGNGADVHQCDCDGNTALHKSVWQTNIEVVEILLAAGAKKDAKNSAGQTPLSMAKERSEKVFGIDKRPWGPEQVNGKPNAKFGDSANAWAAQTKDAPSEWLTVYFSKTVVPSQIEIYENMGPKAVARITVFDKTGGEHTLWQGMDPATKNNMGVYVAKIAVDTTLKTNMLKIYIDSKKVADWNEIDAVALIDHQGEKQWVSWAEASSTYATGNISGLKARKVLQLISSGK